MSDSIPSVASVVDYKQALLAQQVQIAVLAKSNDFAKAEGAAVVEMIESAAEESTETARRINVTA